MRKIVLLGFSATILMAVLAIPGPVGRADAAAACPSIPGDCCQLTRIGGCWVCTQVDPCDIS